MVSSQQRVVSTDNKGTQTKIFVDKEVNTSEIDFTQFVPKPEQQNGCTQKQVMSVEIQTDLALVNLESLAEQFQVEATNPDIERYK